MLTFTIKGSKLSLEQIYYIDARFVVGEHPESGQVCLFIREGEPTPSVALRRLGMRVSSPSRYYKGILYYELKEIGDESEDTNDLHSGEPSDEGVQDQVDRNVVTS